VERIRAWIEGFLRGRYGYEGNQVYRALAGLVLIGALLVAVWQVTGPLLCVGALALVLLALRARRGLRLLATPVLIGAILLVAVWLLPDWLTIPRVSSEGPVVKNGVAVVVACGKKRSFGPMIASEPRTGGWWPEKRGNCTVWYHRPPGLEQRFNRHERAH
jgi:hypothetical protein